VSLEPVFRLALAGSTALHVALLAAVPVTPPAYDVEQAPASVELTFTRARRPQPPVETPPDPTALPSPEPAPVQASEVRGALTQTPPGYVRNPAPVYPTIARARGDEGTVVLGVEVQPDGRCGRVTILSSSGHAVLDEAAADAVRRWVFRPARRWDTPVAWQVEIPVTFRLVDAP
jgi:protein TonB